MTYLIVYHTHNLEGLFDGILMGCIPVTFDALTASVMYTWHWSEEFWKEVSVEIPFQPVVDKKIDPVQYLVDLLKYNLSLVQHKQRLLRGRAFELHYGLDGYHEGGSNSTWPLVDGKPMRDAYEITINHVLGWHSGREPDIRNGTVPECWGGYVNKTLNKCVPGKEPEGYS